MCGSAQPLTTSQKDECDPNRLIDQTSDSAQPRHHRVARPLFETCFPDGDWQDIYSAGARRWSFNRATPTKSATAKVKLSICGRSTRITFPVTDLLVALFTRKFIMVSTVSLKMMLSTNSTAIRRHLTSRDARYPDAADLRRRAKCQSLPTLRCLKTTLTLTASSLSPTATHTPEEVEDNRRYLMDHYSTPQNLQAATASLVAPS